MMNSARMQFVILGLTITLGILVLIQSINYVTAQGANETATANGNNNMTRAQFLFILNADSGSVIEVNDTTSTLQLSNVSDKTISFSDRPNGIHHF